MFARIQALAGPLIAMGILTLAAGMPAFAALLNSPGFHGTVVSRDINDFTLRTADGKLRTAADFKDTYTYLFFGYARCTGVCPRALHELRQFSRESHGKFSVLFISLDPVRDSPGDLRRIEAAGGPAWTALHGPDLRSVQNLARSLHAPYAYDQQAARENKAYQFNHPGFAYLVGPDARLRLLYSTGFSAAELQSDFERLTGSERNPPEERP
ncbi:MAG: SCO family protein [bacterium]|nr:SCO family protein [bacterium]